MIRLRINGQEVFVPQGSSVLEACKQVGVDIPRFCYHERLSVAGNCRMCLVEIEKMPKPVASCAMPVVFNMAIFTDTPLVKKARENVLETLLLNHPLDCPICDQGGECDLQDQTRLFGGDYSRFYEVKRTVEDKYCGPLIKTIMTRCIHCTRCVRFAAEIAGVEALGTLNRGQNTEIGSYLEKSFQSEVSGNVIDLCPVGALTSKPYAFVARPWELRTVESIDFTDSLGSNLYVDHKESEIMRVIPRLNEALNQEWISDKARFSYDSLKRQRINEIFAKDSGTFSVLDWPEALKVLKKTLLPSRTLILVSPNLDLESVGLLSQVTQKKNIRVKYLESSLSDLQPISFHSFVSDVDSSDFCLLLGVNLRLESAVLNIRLRSRWQKGNFLLNSVGIPYKSNIPSNFLGLSMQGVLMVFQGQTAYQRILSSYKSPFVIFGKTFLNRVDSQYFLFSLKRLNSRFKALPVSSYPNEAALAYLGIRAFKSSDLAWSEVLMGINLEDTIRTKTIFSSSKKFRIWVHSNGNSLAAFSDLILPMALPLEYEGVFLNLENRPQRFYKVSDPIKNNRPLAAILRVINSFFQKTSSDGVPKSAWLLLNNFCYLQASFPAFHAFLNGGPIKKMFWNALPLKSNMEDFFLATVYTKSSQIMGQCSQTVRQSATNFL
jgi:NADH-quinone oxidoreductase chain G